MTWANKPPPLVGQGTKVAWFLYMDPWEQEEENCRGAWQHLSNLERNLYIEAKKNMLQQMGTGTY
jgi:thioesterase domain-containing protein